MGRALEPLGGVLNETRPGWWAVITGGPGADANMVLIHDDDEEQLAQLTGLVRREKIPALLMLAGDGIALSAKMTDEWEHAGSMPVMSLQVGAAAGTPDARVRQATAGDTETVIQLIVDAYELDPEVAAVFVRPVLEAPAPVLRYWILEEDGIAVSTVLSGRIDETVSLWCMSTSPNHQRRGYGRALLSAVVDWARNDGATIGLLGATPAGYPLYEATGWSTFEEWQLYVNAPSAQFAH